MYPSPVFSRNNWGSIIIFFFLSLLVHAVLVISIPNFLFVKRIKIIPVIYIQPMEVKLKRLPPLSASLKKSAKAREPVVGVEGPQFALKKARSISAGKGLFLPPPSLQLPVSQFLGKETIPETATSNKKNQKVLGQYTMPSGLPNLLPEATSELPSLPAESENTFREKLVQDLNRKIQMEQIKLAQSQKTSRKNVKKFHNVALGVAGPISARKVLYRPPLPRVVVEHTVQIRLKFWVTPNGIVDQVVPIERGGAHMELVAIRFLKGWKFEPLPLEVRQERQWGILTVKFLVK